MNKEIDYQKVAKLKDGETALVFWSEGGGGEIVRIADKLFIYDVPQYGGEPRLAGIYEIINYKDAVDTCWSWT